MSKFESSMLNDVANIKKTYIQTFFKMQTNLLPNIGNI